ncbi:MAG: condensation domain-containing protein [Cellvibrionaceae bacterium]|nr:condensation domain-containing protein [Cellvibrionaceae bacterium]
MPLSPAQQRLWLVERMSGLSGSQKSAAYNMAAALRLSGELNSAHLQKTLDTILARHEVLRTVYLEDDDGDPIAVVCEPTGLYMPVTDFTHMPVNERQSVVDRILAEFSAQPFELSSCPLVRSQLLRFDPTQHVLLLCIHHIAFDGWSVAVFVREFAAIYEGLNTGVAPLIPALDIQYTDYAVWQHQWLAATSEKNKEFWCRYLDGAPAATTVTADYAKSSKISTAGDALRMKIPGNAVTAINLLARRHETSAFTFLLATFTALLHRWTGASDMVIGTDVAGRSHPALENLIGFFVNVVPLRSRLTAGMTFSQWLRQTKETSLAAFEHQDVPLDQIVDYAKVQRNRGGNPLVQVLFVMQNTPRAHFDIPGLHIEVLPAPVATSKFDIAVFVEENEDGFHVDWIYATSLYQRETMEKMLNMWNELLQQVVATPEAPLEGINTSTITPSPDPLSSLPVAAKAGKLDKLKNIAGRPVASTAVNRSPIRTSFFASDRQFPLVVEAASADQDAVAWARAQRGFIEESLGQYAAVLFRNFGLKTPQDFEAFAEAIEPELHGSYGDLPKKEGGRNIYQSTPYPERQMILYHNESSHLERWPRKQWFFCEVPSRIGGATPIVDCREMLRRLPQDIVRRFEEKGLLYVRTFTPRLDVSWQDFYKTEDTAELEIRLAAAGMTWRWLDKETLQVRSHSPAVITHPLTGDRVFFNQIQLHHPHCLESGMRTDLLDLVGAERMPRQVYYGDGSPIDDETVAVIGHCYEQCTVRFSWQQGDVALLDNMLVAHARDPYQGERKIVVAMGAMFERTALNSTPW